MPHWQMTQRIMLLAWQQMIALGQVARQSRSWSQALPVMMVGLAWLDRSRFC
jgi:hypothetical protein